MAKYTVREFAKTLGLETSGTDYVAMGVVLKLLCDKGIAKEVERINTSARGRKSVVYEVPDTIVLDMTAVATVEEPEEQVVATVEEQVVEETVAEPEVVLEIKSETVVEERGYYDDDEDEEMAA